MRELFESTIERLLADLATPEYVGGCEGGKWPAELWAAVEESGFALAAAPEALGGAEAAWGDLYCVSRALGRHAAPLPLGEAMLGNWLLGRAGLEPRYGVLSIAANGHLSLRDGRVGGRLVDVPWGRHAQKLVALGENPDGTLNVVLLAKADARDCSESLNIAGEPRDCLDFANAAVVAQAPLPEGLDGNVLLLGGAMLRAAQMSGALQALLDMTVGYANERKQFGRAIGAFQAIQQQLAMFAEQVAAASIAAEAAFAESDSELASLSIAAAKVCAGEAASAGAGIGHSVHGAIGFTHEYPLHLLSRRLWAWRSEFGSASSWSRQIGGTVCATRAEGYWPLLTTPASQLMNPEEGAWA
ncbi:acyl-CoA dehydrogenase [Pseudomonas lopnurensis]|uniref:acyl-CoA dehydrogenase n=1 Tax=Pseudomonas lopnurensis TaxID=1477517 RepID=UPI0028A93B7A|nr:acyl-CoA dehydrogenase [Pseudomonas lopnurensis]